MTSLLLILVLAGCGLGLRSVARDGYGRRPPPAVHPEQERMRTWPR